MIYFNFYNFINPDEHGSVKSVSLLRKNKLAVLSQTDRGSLLLYWIDEKQWKVLDKDELFGSYVVMKKNMEETYVALGNTKGTLIKYHFARVVITLSGKSD